MSSIHFPSFRYLVAPSLGYPRSIFYPLLRTRAKYMEYAAKQYGLPPMDGFLGSFNEQESQLPPEMKFAVRIADEVTEALYEKLVGMIERYKGKAPHFGSGSADEDGVIKSFKLLVPAASIDSISAIVNAGWALRLQIDEWPVLNNIEDYETRRQEKLRLLRDLMLKSFEVYEYQKRAGQNAIKLRRDP